jgi:hypothetical protein
VSWPPYTSPGQEVHILPGKREPQLPLALGLGRVSTTGLVAAYRGRATACVRGCRAPSCLVPAYQRALAATDERFEENARERYWMLGGLEQGRIEGPTTWG